MKVVHIIIGLNVGGAELMLKRLIESHIGNSDIRPSVISLTKVGKIGQQLQTLGIEVQALGMSSPLGIPRVLWRLVQSLRNDRPDIVHTWMYHADLLGGVAARLAGNRNVVWSIRATKVKATTKVVRKLCAWLSRLVPHTIVCAAEASRGAHIASGYDASRMVVVPNGFDVRHLVATAAEREAMRLQCSLGQDPVKAGNSVVIGYLGRFHHDKDPENFVRAAGIVAQQHSNTIFLMVGRDLETNNVLLSKWIAKTGYADRFILLGERNDVAVCLAAMDIFCLSSRTEGFPNVVGEAMAMSLPCVVTNVGDAAMLVADAGIVVPKEDCRSLAQGLEQVLRMTSQERQQLGQKAKTRIQTEFTMERAKKRFELIYQQTVEKERQ